MLYLGRPETNSWELTVFAPPREIFAVAEQVAGLPPFNFHPVDDTSAEVVQDIANGLLGQWSKVRRPKNKISIRCEPTRTGTLLRISAQGQRSASMRALNLIRILSRGEMDTATVYRYRHLPPGPCTVVQSWAGTGYPLYMEPEHSAERGTPVRPSSHLRAVEQAGRWVRVRLARNDGTTEEGWIEADQLVHDSVPIRTPAS